MIAYGPKTARWINVGVEKIVISKDGTTKYRKKMNNILLRHFSVFTFQQQLEIVSQKTSKQWVALNIIAKEKRLFLDSYHIIRKKAWHRGEDFQFMNF